MAQTLVAASLALGLLGGVFSMFLLVLSGGGDHPAAYVGYIQACALLISAAVIAAAILAKKGGGT